MMPQKRVNYGRMYKKDRDYESEEPKESIDEEPVVEDSPQHRYRKTVSSKIRIRKGPGLTFGHNGKYVDSDEVMIVKIEDGFGLLADYETSDDGWVSLEYFESAD